MTPDPVTVLESPEAFYRHVSLEDPRLEQAAAASDWDLADRLFAEAVAARWRECPNAPRKTAGERAIGLYSVAADQVLAGTFTLLNQTDFLGARFDWNGRYGIGDREFVWVLNRFNYLDDLWDAYTATGEEKYLDRAVFLMTDWVDSNPAARAREFWGAWRTLEIGLRIPVWCRMVGRFAEAECVSPETIRRLSASLWEQTAYLVAHTGPRRHNWGLMENLGVASFALGFPMVRESSEWLAFGLGNHKADAGFQIYADGAQEELTPHYGLVCLYCFRQMADLVNGCRAADGSDLLTVVERMCEHVTSIAKPDGTIPMINDSDAAGVDGYLLDAAGRFGREDLRFAATRGKAGRPPAWESRLLPDSGFAVMRRGWDENALYLCCDAGPFGIGHQHEDSLCVDVMAYGQRMVSDPGRYLYHRNPIMAYLRQTRAHNTITVDDGNQRRREVRESWRPGGLPPVTWRTEPAFDYLSAEYPFGYTSETAREVRHRREIVFHRERGYWLINDSVLGEGTHTVRLSYQFAPGDLRNQTENRLVFQGERAGMVLIVLGAATARPRIAVGEEDPYLGWYSHVYGKASPAPYVEFVSEESLPVQWQTVLIPFAGQEAPDSSGTLSATAPLTVAVSVSGETEEIVLDSEGSGGAKVTCRRGEQTLFQW